MEIIHWISILIEALIALLGIKLVTQGKPFGWGIFITFGIYVFYDIARYINLSISQDLLYISFFIASLSALWAVWSLTKKRR